MTRVNVRGKVRLMVDPNLKDDPNVLTFKVDEKTAARLGGKWKAGDELPIRMLGAPPGQQSRLAAALKGDLIDEGSQNAIIRALSMINRHLTRFNTTYNPAFFLPNFFRDLMTASVNIKQYEDMGGVEGMSIALMSNIKQSFAAMRGFHRDGKGSNPEWEKLRDEMAKAGGFTKFYGLRTLEDTVKETQQHLAEDMSGSSSGALKKSKAAAKSIIKLIEDYNSTFEDTTRLAVYKTLRDKGFTIDRAAHAAKSMTVNFQDAGSSKLLMNGLYLFYNAGIQGTWAILNAGVRSPKVRKAMMGIVAAGVAQDIMMSLLSGEDDDGVLAYDKIPEYQLRHNMVFIDPFGFTDRGYFMIPLPYGYNAFHNFGRSISQTMRGGTTVGEGATSAVMATVDAFNPLGGTEYYLNWAMPTIVDPFIDIARNRNFANRPIVPETSGFGVERPASQLFWNNTSVVYTAPAKWLSELTGGIGKIPGAIEVSPETLQFWTEYALGGVGTFVRQTFGVGWAAGEFAATGAAPEIETSDFPIVRRLYGNVSKRNDIEAYYERRDQVLEVGATIKDAIESGDRETAMYVRQTYPEEWRIYRLVKSLDNQRSRLTTRIKDIERNVHLSPERKRALIDKLKEQQDVIVGRANTLMAKALE
jgi:hypothetical protein